MSPLQALPRPRTILIVDDDRDALLIHEAILRSAGYRVLKAESGAEGVKAVQRELPDLVLLDVVLPDGNGLDFCGMIRAGAGISGPRIVFLSGIKTGSSEQAMGLRAGADGYMLKPVHPEELLARVEAVLRIKKAEEDLAESEKVFRLLFEQNRDAILWADRDGYIVRYNPAAEKLFERGGDELLGMHQTALHPPDKLEHYRSLFEENIRAKSYLNVDVEIITKSGATRHVNLISTIISVEGREINQGVFVDITETRAAAAELRKREDFLRTLLQTIPIPVFYKDRDGRYQGFNRAFEGFYGKDKEELVGKTVFDIAPPELARIYHAKDEELFAHPGLQVYDVAFFDARGGRHHVVFHKATLTDEHGVVIGLVGAVLDVTEQRLAEEKLRREAAVNKALAEIAKFLTLPDSSLSDIAFVVQKHALELTSSTHGYVSSIDPESGDNVIHTFSSMMDESLCHVQDKRIAFPKEEGVYPCLWGHALNAMAPFFTNAPSSHPAARGVPGGHVPLERFLSVPAIYNGQLYGQIALANAQRDYTREDLDVIASMAHLFAMAVFRWRSEQSLRKSEEKYRRIVETANEGIRILDGRGRITFVNRKMAEMLGYRVEEMLRRNVVDYLHPEELADYHHRMEKRRAGMGEEYLRRHLHKDGRTVWTKISATPITGDQGRFVGSFAMITDITRMKEVEAELVTAMRRAEAANQAKSEFLANMSHEIRTPMNGVIGLTGLLLDTDLNAEQRQLAENVRHSAESLLCLINDILDLSKIEAGHLELEALDFDLRDLLQDIVQTMIKGAQDKGLDLTCSIDPDIPPRLRGDPVRLRQVLNNLVSNAVKFTEAGKVTISVSPDEQARVRESAKNGEVRLRFAVQDTGIGIPEDKLDAIFDKFSQVDASTTRRFGGTGLGLSISKQLVELMGGKIIVKSRVGGGSEFSFTVSLECWDAAATSPSWTSRDQRAGSTLPRLSGRVLLAEDTPVNQQVALGLLRKMGLAADTAGNGFEVLQALAEKPYDVVLMDVMMPGMDGLEATRRIRSQEAGGWSQNLEVRSQEPENVIQHTMVTKESAESPAPGRSPRTPKRVPIIAMTAGAMPSDKERCFQAGMDDFVVKPVNPQELARALCKWLQAADDQDMPAREQVRQPSGAAPQLQVFNRAELCCRCMDDDALVQEVLRVLLETIAQKMSVLRAHLGRNDLQAAYAEAHGLKGAALNSSCPALAEAARQVELACLEKGQQGLADAMRKLEDEARKVRLMISGDM